jgi:hypothetical protein
MRVKYRNQLLLGLSKSLTSTPSDDKTKRIRLLDSWAVLSNEQMKALLERSSLSDIEKAELGEIILKAKAFEGNSSDSSSGDDIPF